MKVLWILLLISSNALAWEHTSFSYGLGLNRPDNSSIASIKYFGLSYQAPWFLVIDYKLELGGFVDTNLHGNDNSGVISGSLGTTVDLGFLYLSDFWGLAGINHPGVRLTSVYQFQNDLEVGFKDKRNVSIGADLKHLSNGGLSGNNLGRDFVLIKIGIPY